MFGAGTASCGEWTQVPQTRPSNAGTQWLHRSQTPKGVRGECLMLRSGECPILGCAGRPASSLHGCGSDHIVRRQGPPDPLQLELTNWLDLHGVLDLHQYPGTDENLSWLGFVAKPRGYIGHRPDSGIVEPALEADGAQRGKAVRNADAEANLVPEAAQVAVKAPIASRTSSAMRTA